MGASGCHCSALSAVETPQRPHGVWGGGQGYLRDGGSPFSHSQHPLSASHCGLSQVWRPVGHTIVESWSVEQWSQSRLLKLPSEFWPSPIPAELKFWELGQGVHSMRSLMIARA